MGFNSAKTRMIAMDVFAGKDTPQVQKITTAADVTGSLGGKYFLFKSTSGAKHYVWFNTGSSVDPAPAGGWTGHAATITSGASATAVATAIVTALTAVSGFTTTASGSVVTLTCSAPGYAEPARDSDLLANKSGFAFSVFTQGQAETKLGLLEGEVSLSGFGTDEIEVKSHQAGSTVLGKIVTGMKNPELSFTLQESDLAAIKSMFLWSGQNYFTPEGADATEGVGYGTNLLGGAKPRMMFRLHPIAKGSDRSEDWNLWSCDSNLDKFAFTSDKIVTIPVKVTAYIDDSKPIGANIIYVGDARSIA